MRRDELHKAVDAIGARRHRGDRWRVAQRDERGRAMTRGKSMSDYTWGSMRDGRRFVRAMPGNNTIWGAPILNHGLPIENVREGKRR